MGKTQKKRKTRRHNPVRVPDSHLPKGLEAAAATSSRKDAVLPIIQKLESVDAQERTWACSAVSNLIQNDPSTRRLLQGKNIVGVLITRLTDSVEEVVVEAAGALRNLCIDGGYDICAEMYNKNILAPLQTFIPKISSALHQLVTSPKSAPSNASDLVYGLAENVITLIWCLSETSNKALNAINSIHIVPFLMAFLENRERLPSRTVAAAAQCLYVLTVDNPSAIDELRSSSSYTSCLLSVTRTDSTPVSTPVEAQELAEDRLLAVKLLSAGILGNISPVPAPSVISAIDIDRTVILPLVIPVLTSVPLAETAERVLELVRLEQEEPKSGREKLFVKNTPKSDHKSPAEHELERIEAKLQNVRLSLEILTGVCATLPDPEPVLEAEEEVDEDVDVDGDEDEDENENEGSEDKEDVEMDGVEPEPEPEFELKANGTTPPSASAPSFLTNILSPLLTLLQPTPLSFPPVVSATSSATAGPAPPAHPPTTSLLGAIHVGALECLNNACLALAHGSGSGSGPGPAAEAARTDAEDGRRLWDALWAALGAVGLEGGRGQERRREMWEVAAGVMWGVGGIWKGCIVPNEEQVGLLMQLCDASTDPQVKVECIGALGCLAHHPDSIEANRIISEYLLGIASSPTLPSEPIFEAASALIDIYADEGAPYDTNFRQGGYLEALARATDTVRRAVRAVDRKKDGGSALRARGEETLENLRAFVKYRRDLKL